MTGVRRKREGRKQQVGSPRRITTQARRGRASRGANIRRTQRRERRQTHNSVTSGKHSVHKPYFGSILFPANQRMAWLSGKSGGGNVTKISGWWLQKKTGGVPCQNSGWWPCASRNGAGELVTEADKEIIRRKRSPLCFYDYVRPGRLTTARSGRVRSSGLTLGLRAQSTSRLRPGVGCGVGTNEQSASSQPTWARSPVRAQAHAGHWQWARRAARSGRAGAMAGRLVGEWSLTLIAVHALCVDPGSRRCPQNPCIYNAIKNARRRAQI